MQRIYVYRCIHDVFTLPSPKTCDKNTHISQVYARCRTKQIYLRHFYNLQILAYSHFQSCVRDTVRKTFMRDYLYLCLFGLGEALLEYICWPYRLLPIKVGARIICWISIVPIQSKFLKRSASAVWLWKHVDQAHFALSTYVLLEIDFVKNYYNFFKIILQFLLLRTAQKLHHFQFALRH